MSGQTFHSIEEMRRSFGYNGSREPTGGDHMQGQGPIKKEMPDFLKEDADYVSIAEEHVKKLGDPSRYRPGKIHFGNLTTSKIRNLLSLVNRIYNKIFLLGDPLPESAVGEIRYLKVRLVYESGREPKVRDYCEKSGLIDAIDFIGTSKKRFLRYAKYMEALVAYHRFYTDENTNA